MTILALCCTYGRHICLERSVRMFLDQNYYGKHIMFIFNSGPEMKLALPTLPANKQVILYNCMREYTSVGQKFNDALKNAMKLFNPDVITSWDDDDTFLPNHLLEGRNGIVRASNDGLLAYKPKYSYYKSSDGLSLVANTMEPSIFVDAKYLLEKGYKDINVTYHQQWLDPLIEEQKILIEEQGVPTMVYNWVGEVYKMSGTGDDSYANYEAHRGHSIDFGDGIILPIESAKQYYDEVKRFNNG